MMYIDYIANLQKAMRHSNMMVSMTYLRGLEINELEECDMPVIHKECGEQVFANAPLSVVVYKMKPNFKVSMIKNIKRDL